MLGLSLVLSVTVGTRKLKSIRLMMDALLTRE